MKALRALSASHAGWLATAACLGVLAGCGTGAPHSRAGNQVQAQPAAGSCHAIGHGLYERSDPRCTPGALNPAVRQANIQQTICVTGWTATVRPPEAVTETEKRASLAAYGDSGPVGNYEYDHLVPLELGRATNDPRDLWPEPGASPNPKDAVERLLRDRVCAGQLSLAQAQREIASNWVRLAPRRSRPPGRPSGTPGRCTARAVYNARYGDYDVYVASNQPGAEAVVSGSGRVAHWRTDATGRADVYFKAGRAASGQPVTVQVGSARCSAKL